MGAASPEDVLDLRSELLAINSFEFAVRERVGRLSTFQHPLIAQAFRVERARDRRGSLAIVCAAIDGTRLSTVLAAAERDDAAIDPIWAMRVVHQILDAISALHKSDRDVVHGAIAPERIVISSSGQAIVADYVLGSAIEQLKYPAHRYWTELGVSANAIAGKFTQRLDLRQVGVVALALLLGRRLYDEEAAAEEASVQAAMSTLPGAADRSTFAGEACRWVRRTLEYEAPFATAADAADVLAELLDRDYAVAAPDHSEPAPVPAIAEAVVDIEVPPVAPAPLTQVAPAPVEIAVEPDDSIAAADNYEVEQPASHLSSLDFESLFLPEPEPIVPAPPAPAPVAREITEYVALPAAVQTRVATPPAAKQPATAKHLHATVGSFFSGARRHWLYFAIAAACVVAAAGLRYRASGRPQPVADVSLGTLTVTTPRPGATVLVDQIERGVTPLNVKVAAGQHSLELRQDADRRSLPVTVAAGVVTAQYVEVSSGPAVGALRVRTQPEGALVSVDGVAAGRSPVTLNEVTPGEHTVTVTGDFAPIKQTVVVERGATASVLVSRQASAATEGAGWIGITAPFPVQVFEQDGLLGSSASARIMLSAGTHQLELVNTTLGYRVRRSVQVAPGKVAAIAIDAPKGTVALNAIPWATVWLDGESLGETPLGNVTTTVGTHQLVFRNPTLGEQRRTITVPVNGTVKVGVDLRATGKPQ